MKNFINEFKWRKLIKNKTKNINLFFKKKKNIYIGFDPTFKSLHIGHLLAISIILRLYKYGYNVIIILGEYTTKILKNNKKNIYYKKKIFKQLNFFFKKKKNIKIINNKKWLKKINLIKFITKIFKIISINNIINKKIFKKKILNNDCIYLSEFIYPIIQGYDYLYLNKNNNCNLQFGGSDQWGNILIGINMNKKINNKKVFGFTFPLLLNSKGKKFSKSNNKINNIWLNKKYTSIYNFYQYFINLNDNESIKYIKYFSFEKKKKIIKIINKHNKKPEIKLLQKKLSKMLTIWVHGKKNYKNIKYISNILFKKKYNIINSNNIFLIKKLITKKKININNNKKIIIINDLIKNNILFKSKTEYKKFYKNNGLLLINGKKIINNIISDFNNLLEKKFLIIQKGKKKFLLLIINKKNIYE
ncbi:MAG: tyrosine--tRNA ligase [Candidatus Shikimatogenerans bostrichidophilus]|nr:MAG: tyrosine--tRNA ligase [Candidatus Shikimatogenerans bostrichidophilus]